MGRIIKKFTAVRGTKTSTGTAQIDSGADQTVLGVQHAHRLGIDLCTTPSATLVGVGKGRLMGVESVVRVTIGKRTANVAAFVPLVRVLPSGKRQLATSEENLIGHDFLQVSGAKLDYSKEHRDVFSGYFRERLRHATPGETREMREMLKCPRPAKRKKR